jgi:NAD-dependent deacetylase
MHSTQRSRVGVASLRPMVEEVRGSFDEVRRWLDEARRVVVLTGAGISTESGIPDFRGPNGLWTKDPAAEKASNIRFYVGDPEIRKRAWRRRAEQTHEPEPNAGHRALVDLERSGRLLALLTQNVDGLHVAAGSDPALVVEVHGTVRDVQCLDCGERAPMERALERVRAGEEDPPCRTCGGILKSATVSFGQGLDPDDLRRADATARACDLLLALGTTLGVYPIAEVVPLAVAHGARVAIVNDAPTEMDDLADAVLRGALGEVLPALVADLAPVPLEEQAGMPPLA